MYRKGLNRTLLRCLEEEESKLALKDIHEGICGSHSNGLNLAKKILRMGYFWKTLERDGCQYVKVCKKYQYHGNLIHAPSQELQPFVTPWPFYQWGFDLIGMIYPPSSNRHKYIIIATKYFTKWVEAVPLSTAIGKQISMFILNHIICRYGIPHAIITDNGK